ncbi:hypothetical protein CsSME_00052017 [Camellia sinensis var. sinensis]
MMMSARTKCPFTATQWQELEQQALIFKYMVSGVPIPPHLISTVKTSMESSSVMSSRFYPHQPIGWGSFEMGYGRKVDPEPGRCRRTDGKKWRCSKEAHPDSKYCERHMHRGRHRSRKPVEVITTTTTNSSSIPPTTNPNSAGAAATTTSIISYSLSAESYPFLNPHSSSSSRPPGFFLSPQSNTTHHLFSDSGSYSQAHKDYSSYVHGVRDEVDSRAPFPEASGTPLTTSSSNTAYSQLDFHSLTGSGKSREQQQQQQQQQQKQHCFVLGSDFRSGKPMEVERGEEKQKPFHHFFGEWQPKSREYTSWLDIEEEEENQSSHGSFSTTQLSISMPPSTQELFGSKSTFPTVGEMGD